MRSAARARREASGRGRAMTQVRGASSSSGQSKASAWTSWGKASVTAPVSAGEVSTRMAAGSASMSISGRSMRSK